MPLCGRHLDPADLIAPAQADFFSLKRPCQLATKRPETKVTFRLLLEDESPSDIRLT
jgi:hypothetical protein